MGMFEQHYTEVTQRRVTIYHKKETHRSKYYKETDMFKNYIDEWKNLNGNRDDTQGKLFNFHEKSRVYVKSVLWLRLP